ncbi:hypothetical protein HY214_04890, partial [Candidatus Roizmanbacteria bacterium]|nr:hypothetical protein [Candidatus Roizmanbacteria bacterium]
MVSLTILLITAVLFGLRHGIDWDHLAAIADISGSAVTTREGWWYGTLYALGHAMVILVLGFAAVLFGLKLPAWVDRVMEPIVGTTLIILGLWLIVAVLTQGKSFRLKSRWMLLFELYKKVHRHPAVSKNTGEKLAPSG